jgi:hypothetical protein
MNRGALLKAGATIQFRYKSRRPLAPDVQRGQLVTVTPVLAGEQLRAGDVVFCEVHGTGLLRIREVKVTGDGQPLWLVGDNTHDYGWAGFMKVHGRLVCVED